MLKTFVFVLALAVPAAAQTMGASIDLASFGWGNLDTPVGIETDGNPYTVEWLIRSLDNPGQVRVVAVRGSGICAGPWFNPTAVMFSGATITRVGNVDKILVRTYGSTVVQSFDLNTPACQ